MSNCLWNTMPSTKEEGYKVKRIIRLTRLPLLFVLFAKGLVTFTVTYMPGPFGDKLRYYYYKSRCKYLGRNVKIDLGVTMRNPRFISIYDNSWIDKYVILEAGKINTENLKGRFWKNPDFDLEEGELKIGSNCHIAPFCLIQAHAGISIGNNIAIGSGGKIYSISNVPVDPQNPSQEIYFTPMRQESAYYYASIVIKDNVGIALNSVVFPGVTIEEKSFVAPNSIVMTKIKSNSYAAGNPAKKIRERFLTDN